MNYIHIRSLEKYHPGYKDRELQWAKIYINMASGDPDCEMIDNEIDWARLIKMILLELRAKKPLPNSDDYWTKKGFDLQKRPMALTLQMLHNFISFVEQEPKECVLDKIREDKRREDKEQDKEQDTASPELRSALDKVYKKGLNIYALINKLKKDTKAVGEVPEAVLLGVCGAFENNRAKIENEWAWFVRVLKVEWEKWNAENAQKLNNDLKKQGMAQSLKDLLGMR